MPYDLDDILHSPISEDDLIDMIDTGGRFVTYLFTISLVFVTYKRSSKIFFVPAATNTKMIVQGLPYTFISALAGWWGFPWGPAYTIESLATNIMTDQLGVTLTAEVYRELKQRSVYRKWSHPYYRRYERFLAVVEEVKELIDEETAFKTAQHLIKENETPGPYFDQWISYYKTRINSLKLKKMGFQKNLVF